MEIRRINNGKIFYFGNEVIPKYSFNAKELDEETGMYYFEARYYRAPTFISRDPLMNEKPWLTPYHYCSNNPVGRIDPTGMMDEETIEIALEPKSHKDDDVGKTVIYKDGKLYNKNEDGTIGDEYTGNSSYARAVQKDLNRLKEESSDLADIIYTLESDTKHTHTISMIARSYNEEGLPVEPVNGMDVLSDENASDRKKGSGTNITYNPWNKYVQGPKPNQTTTRPPRIGLAHELGHSWRAHTGTADFKMVNGLSNFERQAMRVENKAREALNLPLRSKY